MRLIEQPGCSFCPSAFMLWKSGLLSGYIPGEVVNYGSGDGLGGTAILGADGLWVSDILTGIWFFGVRALEIKIRR